MKDTPDAKEVLYKMKWSPLFFIQRMWNLTPQPLICSVPECIHNSPQCFGQFIKGTHITWQQYLIIKKIEDEFRKGNNHIRISVKAGNGIGKDTMLVWLIHWYLFTRFDSQIGCTAPSRNQMYDVLWKELSIWHHKLPKTYSDLFEWSTTHYKIKERPDSWWARARTASKENPEAFKGMHGKYVFLIADEASGVADEIVTAGEGSLTGENTLVLYVSNPEQLDGFFYDTHHKDKDSWNCFSFSGLDSPIVKQEFIDGVITKYGLDSNEYRFMVLGEFPKEEGIRKGGWMPLLQESDLKFCDDPASWKQVKMGVDPSGQGLDSTAHVIRNPFYAKVVSLEKKSNTKSVVETTTTLMEHYRIPVEEVGVDNFGIGANVPVELAMIVGRCQSVNVGDLAEDPERYFNRRAELYWRLREWLIAGGQLVRDEGWKELLTIFYKSVGGRIQIMSKVEMKDKYGYPSPNVADGLSLTFIKQDFGKLDAEINNIFERNINRQCLNSSR